MLGYILKLTRIAINMSTKEAAIKAGTSSTYISEVESGNKTPSLSMLKKIAITYDISVSKLLLFEELATEQNLNYQETLKLILEYYVNEQKESSNDKSK